MFCCVGTGQIVGFGNFGVASKGSVRVSFLVCWCVFAWIVCSWLVRGVVWWLCGKVW